MHKHFYFSLFLFFTNLFTGEVNGKLFQLATRLQLKGTPSPPGAPWPHPAQWTWKNTTYTLDPDTVLFQATNKLMSCDVIEEAIKKFRSKTTAAAATPDDGSTEVAAVQLEVKDDTCPGYPGLHDDESYELTVNATGVRLTSQTVWGLVRGFETLNQIIHITEENKYCVLETAIRDTPRFPHRGLMVDTARHFMPLPLLLSNLDVMAYNKLNVFHWHIVDDQSFPFVSLAYPDLSKKGAFSPDHVYTADDVKMVIDEARLRGIRVIPEFDMPGHSKSWGNAYPDLLTPCWGEGKPDTPKYPEFSEREIFNPTLNSTFEFLSGFLREISERFPDEYVHLGMDEAYVGCWNSSRDVHEFMTKMGIDGVTHLQEYFMNRTSPLVKETGSKLMIWHDPIDMGALPPKETLIQMWKDTNLFHLLGPWRNYTSNVVNKGYDVIISSPWYLNMIKYGNNWRDLYEAEPLDFPVEDEAHYERVLGGEACLWAEYVDATNFLSRVWPRASAVAERLWSPRDVNNTDDAMWRLHEHRCRMVRRGTPAQPIFNSFCGDYDWGLQTSTPETSGVARIFSPVLLLGVTATLLHLVA